MNPELDLETARRILRERREDLFKEQREERDRTESLLERRVDREGEEGDAAVLSRTVSLDRQLNDRDTERRHLIDDALDRIETGTYGSCVRCDEPIGADRLRAIPETPLCIACAEDAEKQLEHHQSLGL